MPCVVPDRQPKAITPRRRGSRRGRVKPPPSAESPTSAASAASAASTALAIADDRATPPDTSTAVAASATAITVAAVAASATATASAEYVLVGRVVRVIGLRGCLRVAVLTDFPGRLAKGRKIRLRHPHSETTEEFRIRGVRATTNDNFLDLHFDGITSRDHALRFRGGELVIPAAQRHALPDDRFYPDELPGMQVVDHTGRHVGEVVSLEAECPAPYLVVQSCHQREVLIPFRKVFITSIERKSRVVQLAGLLDQHIPA